MSEKRMFRLVHREARANCIDFISRVPDGYVVTVKAPTRSLAANARMWALLADVSEQVTWYSQKLSPESWKCIFSASLKKQEVVPNLEGTGFVVLGQATSKMSVSEMNELQALIEAFGAERGVRFNDAEAEATA